MTSTDSAQNPRREPLEPDAKQITLYVNALFKYAHPDGYVSARAFFEGDSSKAFARGGISLKGGLDFVIESLIDHARRCAQFPQPVVCCPPVCIFDNPDRATEKDQGQGIALSVELDTYPQRALKRLIEILGPPTVVVASGGRWKNPETGELEDKLHAHWRLKAPGALTKDDLAKLKEARKLAAAIVGGDPTNVPAVHPIRMPGSWHRKAEPRLCSIATLEDAREIDLTTALAALKLAAPSQKTSGNAYEEYGKEHGSSSGPTAHIAVILSGEDGMHAALVRLGAYWVATKMPGGAIVTSLRSLMQLSAARVNTPDRWQKRYNEIPEIVRSAEEKFAQPEPPKTEPPTRLIQTSAEFVKGFVPPDYVFDPLQQGFLYTLTALTGGGKTAIMLLIAALKALGRALGATPIDSGRVLYLAGENPDDVRMRWIALGHYMGFDPNTIDVHFIAGAFKIAELTPRVFAEAATLGGEFSLVMTDTSAVYFGGTNENDTVELLAHAKALRNFTKLPGRPTSLAASHPTKNAGPDNLIPRGAGAFLNELDGNLTAVNKNMVVDVHWQGKFRGPDFAPFHFKLETKTYPTLVDSKGRPVPTLVASHLTDEAKEELAKVGRTRENELLLAIVKYPGSSYVRLAEKLGWNTAKGQPYKQLVFRTAQSLKQDRLIHIVRGDIVLTELGKAEAKKLDPMDFNNAEPFQGKKQTYRDRRNDPDEDRY